MPLGLLTLISVVLLPIIPAYFLFKALPSSTDVKGPFQGLQVKLGGAFAGYFLLFVFIIARLNTIMPAPSSEVWEVSGHVTDANGGHIMRLDPNDVTLSPPHLYWDNDGGFTIRATTTSTPAGGTEYPKLNIGHTNFQYVTISLDPRRLLNEKKDGIRIDAEHHQIEFANIALTGNQPSAPYSASGTPPPRATPTTEEPHQ